jgi:hypothetical protein
MRVTNLIFTLLFLIFGFVLTFVADSIDPNKEYQAFLIGAQVITAIIAFFTNRLVWATHTRK